MSYTCCEGEKERRKHGMSGCDSLLGLARTSLYISSMETLISNCTATSRISVNKSSTARGSTPLVFSLLMSPSMVYVYGSPTKETNKQQPRRHETCRDEMQRGGVRGTSIGAYLPSAGLSISKQTAVLAARDAFHHGMHRCLIHLLLPCLGPKHLQQPPPAAAATSRRRHQSTAVGGGKSSPAMPQPRLTSSYTHVSFTTWEVPEMNTTSPRSSCISKHILSPASTSSWNGGLQQHHTKPLENPALKCH